MSSPWIFCRAPRRCPTLRLVCIPNAGRGATMFNPWPADLPASVEVCAVQLPGRESRIREPGEPSLDALLPKLVDALAPVRAGDYAIYGHSLGALVAFALTRELRRRGERLPLHLVVSGRRAPQCTPPPRISHLSSEDFLAELTRQVGPLPAAILSDPGFLALCLRTIRADIQLTETYRYTEEPPLPVPLAAYGGRRDATTDDAMIAAWSAHTSAGFKSRMFDGDHAFPDSLRTSVVRAVAEDLALAV